MNENESLLKIIFKFQSLPFCLPAFKNPLLAHQGMNSLNLKLKDHIRVVKQDNSFYYNVFSKMFYPFI